MVCVFTDHDSGYRALNPVPFRIRVVGVAMAAFALPHATVVRVIATHVTSLRFILASVGG
jgi:hypothetical protein